MPTQPATLARSPDDLAIRVEDGVVALQHKTVGAYLGEVIDEALQGHIALRAPLHSGRVIHGHAGVANL